ncbi:MAG: O-antigen ligase family protein [Candidatus Falkowbacteria bacterium]
MKKFIINSGASWLSELAVLIIIGLTPVFFNYFSPTNIDLNKLVIFKVFTLLLLFATVWRFSEFKLNRIQNLWFRLLPFLILFGFLVLSLVFSTDLVSSWFGSYDRHEGLVSWLFYGLWAILIALHLESGSETEKNQKIRRLLAVASGSSFLVSVYAILQVFGWDFMTWSESPAFTGRAVSFLGQPNYLACWLIIVLPLSAYLFQTAKNNLGRFIWGVSFIVGLGGLLATGSRAAFLVFLIVSILWSLWFLASQKILSQRKIALIFLSGLTAVVLFGIFLAFSNHSRFEEFTDIKKGSAYVRLELWQSGFQAYLKKPFLGYGLENQTEAYAPYYKIDWAIYARPNTYSDRAHNLILDTLLTGGLFGLMVLVYFLWWVYNNLFKALRNKENSKLAAFLIWSLSAYLISLLFNFSVTVTNIYFWLIVGLSLATSGGSLVTWSDKKNSELARLIIIISTAALFFYGAVSEINRLTADYYFNQALEATTKSEYFTALVLNDYLDKTHPDLVSKSFYSQGLSLRLLESLPSIQDKSSIFAINKYLKSNQQIITGNNFESRFVRAFILGIIGPRRESDALFKSLASLSPEMPKIYLAWGDTLFFNQDYLGAKIKFSKALSLLPDINNKYLNNQQRYFLNIYLNQINTRLIKTESLIK